MSKINLTMEQRMQCYKLAAKIVNIKGAYYVGGGSVRPEYSGACYALSVAAFELGFTPYEEPWGYSDEDAPEFHLQKPITTSSDGLYWPIEDRQSRVDALEYAAEFCREQLSEES